MIIVSTRRTWDIAGLTKVISDEPVYIFGSSSGSIVAMHVLKDYPEVVKRLHFMNHQLIHFTRQYLLEDKMDDIVHQILTEGLERYENIW